MKVAEKKRSGVMVLGSCGLAVSGFLYRGNTHPGFGVGTSRGLVTVEGRIAPWGLHVGPFNCGDHWGRAEPRVSKTSRTWLAGL